MTLRVLTDDRVPVALPPAARTLVYFPHGLGDWAQLGYVTPLLGAAGRIAFTRVGDDYVAALDGAEGATALYGGRNAVGGPVHRSRPLRLPGALDAAVERWRPEIALWPEFHDRGGGDAFPFHTKARRFARAIVPAERLAHADLDRPLPSGLARGAPPAIAARVDARLRAFVARGERLCVLVRHGHSDPLKAWSPADARAFVDALGDGWRVVTFQDPALAGARTLDWTALAAGAFGDVPFALALRAVLARTALAVGVPAGPYHLAHARGDVPCVGIWLHQHPDWYEEPHANARQLVGGDVVARGWHRRRASRTLPPSWRHEIELLPGRAVPAEAVLAAAAALGIGRVA